MFQLFLGPGRNPSTHLVEDEILTSRAFFMPGSPQNKPECNYDAGDCCSCTCEDKPTRTCGGNQYYGFASVSRIIEKSLVFRSFVG